MKKLILMIFLMCSLIGCSGFEIVKHQNDKGYEQNKLEDCQSDDDCSKKYPWFKINF